MVFLSMSQSFAHNHVSPCPGPATWGPAAIPVWDWLFSGPSACRHMACCRRRGSTAFLIIHFRVRPEGDGRGLSRRRQRQRGDPSAVGSSCLRVFVYRSQWTHLQNPAGHLTSHTEYCGGGLNYNGHTGSEVWILQLQLMELLGKDQEVWPCWSRCVTGAGHGGFKDFHYA